ncbi:MAG: hypothetical protein H8E53_03130 [Planctomycetes bacterium]|nr:hypothetical protein [Planctomycetota bacterium]
MKADTTDEYYNVGMGTRTTIRELAELLLDITGSELDIQYEPAGATFVKNRVGCPKKAADQIGFEAKVELRDGLKRLIEWRSAHKDEVDRRQREAGVTDD